MLVFFGKVAVRMGIGACGGVALWYLLGISGCRRQALDPMVGLVEAGIYAGVGAVLAGWNGAVHLLREGRARRADRTYLREVQAWADERGFLFAETIDHGELASLVGLDRGHRWRARLRVSANIGGTEVVLLDTSVAHVPEGAAAETEDPFSGSFLLAVFDAVPGLPEFHLVPIPRWLGRLGYRLGLVPGTTFHEPPEGDEKIRAFRDKYHLVPLKKHLSEREITEEDAALRAIFSRKALHHFTQHPGLEVMARRGRLLVVLPGNEWPGDRRDAFLAAAVSIREVLSRSGSQEAEPGEFVPGEPPLHSSRLVRKLVIVGLNFLAGFLVGVFLESMLWTLLGGPPFLPCLFFFGLPLACGAAGVLLLRRIG